MWTIVDPEGTAHDDIADQAALTQTRIIGCTTTGAAIYKSLIESARPTVVIVEEAAEILEAHGPCFLYAPILPLCFTPILTVNRSLSMHAVVAAVQF